MFQRIVLIVLDGVGIGALPDAEQYGDGSAATLQHVARESGPLRLPHLEKMGLGRIVPEAFLSPTNQGGAAFGRMAEVSAGKDSVTGHWELSGVILDQPFATFPDGFPAEIIQEFTRVTGYVPLGNLAASGTEILKVLGEQHLRTGQPIIYTSSDSVFQIAAHEEIIPRSVLYHLCHQVEEILKPYRVCRVIARPFVGNRSDNFTRTSGRHDFPQAPPKPTLLDRLNEAGIATVGVGKIGDLFAGRGLSETLPTQNNRDGMRVTRERVAQLKSGLIMTNLVDFDMLYGHRLDSQGFARALEEFDAWLPELLESLSNHDLLVITADHGCDPTTPGTDHTREYVPLLVWAKQLRGVIDLGTRESFADVAATIAENFKIPSGAGWSFLSQLQLLPAPG